MRASELAVLVLAAGAGSRFAAAAPHGGTSGERRASPAKLLATLDGRPILEHVLDRAAGFDPVVTLVVLGSGPGADALENLIRWRAERRVRNPRPERGLAGSVRIGLDALAASFGAPLQAALILLGDQPRVRVAVMRRLLDAAAESPERPIVAPRYARGGGSNPLLIRREAWSLAAGLEGDRGFGPLLVSRPELVRFVPVTGGNPDVDTPADLARLADTPADLARLAVAPADSVDSADASADSADSSTERPGRLSRA